MIALLEAPPAPLGLLYLATFSRAERAEIAAAPDLMAAIRAASPADWPSLVDQYRRLRRSAKLTCPTHREGDSGGMRRQALNDLRRVAGNYAALTDGRRNELFRASCRLAKYVVHNVIGEAELRAALLDASAANGALAKYGLRWLEATIARGLAFGGNDELPPLARRFSSGGAHGD